MSIHNTQGEEQRELLAEISVAPEVGMRHTLAAGSLPFSSLNQACLRDAACLYVPERVEMEAPVQVSYRESS